jgi:hypothetical protein
MPVHEAPTVLYRVLAHGLDLAKAACRPPDSRPHDALSPQGSIVGRSKRGQWQATGLAKGFFSGQEPFLFQ